MSTALRRLIVNADDFGASDGVNRGIVRAFEHGVVTSTSLMVRMPAAEVAAELARERPELSVGLHVDFTGEGTPAPADIDDIAACAVEMRAQLERFEDLVGRPPTHIDSHHHVHRFRPSRAAVRPDRGRDSACRCASTPACASFPTSTVSGTTARPTPSGSARRT